MAENVIKKDIVDIQKDNMLQYMLSLMYDRAIPDIRDGLKPVQKFILWSCYSSGFFPNKPHVKCAKIAGDVIANYHPHSLDAAYEALCRMAQEHSMSIAPIDFHGACGSIDGSGAAAHRYTEARLSKYGVDLMNEIEKDSVDFEKNYDVTKDQPTVLPSVIPNILINSSMGIAGGYASSIPPHNVKDICNVVCQLIDDPDMSVQSIAKKLVPDFPTGGILCSKKDVEKAYITGQGSVKLRARTNIVKNKNGTSEIVITEIPYMTTIGPRMSGTSTNTDGGLINSIVAKIKDGTIEGIKDIHDISDKNGLCIKIFIKKDYDPDVILNQLYKFTQLESTYKIILVCKNGNNFKVYNIKEILTEWLEFRVSTIRRIISYDIRKAKYREHILEGLLKALTDIDTVISIIKKANGRAEAKTKLVAKYGFTDLQVEAILDMKISQINSLDSKKLEEEKLSKQKEILTLKESWKDQNIYERIKKEQKEFVKKYGKDRKTTVEEINTEITTEDIIADEDTLIVITQGNYIKRVSNEFRTQKRGTQGISIGDNSITEMFSASTKDHLLCFTNTGRVYDLKAYDIKESKDLKAKGLRIENYLNLKDSETVTNILCINNTQMNDTESFLVFATKNGMIKKTKLEEFNNIRSTGIIALMLKANDELVSVKYIDTSKEMQDILISTKNAQTVRYDHEEIKELGRNTYGVTGICLENNDCITDMVVIENDNQLIFFATKQGLGKTVLVTDNVEKVDPNSKEKVTINDGFPRLKRSSTIKGRLCMKLKDDDELVSMVAINNEDNDELMVVTNTKLLVVESNEFKIPLKRPTYGKKLVSLTNDDFVRRVILK